jgi:hypothetical protein
MGTLAHGGDGHAALFCVKLSRTVSRPCPACRRRFFLRWLQRVSQASCGCQECHPGGLTRVSPHFIAPTTMCDVESNSVGNGSEQGTVRPGQMRFCR